MSDFTLRPYQREAIDALYQYWSDGRGENPLIVAPTGSGKTALIAQIVKDAMSFPGTRVMIVSHVKELLEQGANGLLQLYSGADFGFYSASIGQKRLDKPITFAGIQSVWEKASAMIPPPDLVIVDEAHMIPQKSTTRYNKFLDDLKACNPQVKVIGMTATPYRLDSGYLHKGDGAIFDGIAYDIPIGKLMDDGYLAPIISKGGLKQIDLSGVKKRGGEFVEADLAVAASDPELVRATVKEIVTLGGERRSWLVFASGLDHADLLANEFANHEVDCEVVKGSDGMKDRAEKIARFKRREIRCIINCGVLTTGFDAPEVDLVAIVRATASTGLYVQIVGRGTRIAPGKEDCLVLDYGQNVERHGFIDAVKPTIKGAGDGTGEAPARQCPSCQTMCHAAAQTCPECGHQFPPPSLNHAPKSYAGAMLFSQVQAEWKDVNDVTYQRWQKQGKPDSIRVTYECGFYERISEWLCPDHGGYAASRYHARMSALGATASTTEDALTEAQQWHKPSRIKVKPDGKYWQIVQLDYSAPKPSAPDPEQERIRQLAQDFW